MDYVTCLIPSHTGEKENWLSSQLPYQTDPWDWTATPGRVGGHRTGTVQTSMPGSVEILLCSHNKLLGKRERSRSFHGANIRPSLAAIYHSHPLSGSLGGHVYSTEHKSTEHQQEHEENIIATPKKSSVRPPEFIRAFLIWGDRWYLLSMAGDTSYTQGLAECGPPQALRTPALPSKQPQSVG